MAEVNVWEAYFLLNHWQVCKIFPRSCEQTRPNILFIKYRRSVGESRSFCLCHHLHSCLQAVGFKQSFTFHMIMQIQSCSCALRANTLLRSFLKQSSSYFWILLLSVSATKKVFCSLLATHIHTHAFSVIHTRSSCCCPWLTTVP